MPGVPTFGLLVAESVDRRDEAFKFSNRALGVALLLVPASQGHRGSRSHCVADYLRTAFGGVAHLAQKGFVLAPLLCLPQPLYLAPPRGEVLSAHLLRVLSNLEQIQVVIVHTPTVSQQRRGFRLLLHLEGAATWSTCATYPGGAPSTKDTAMTATSAPDSPSGLLIQVVRPAPSPYGDLTCGGVSAESKHLTLIGIVDADGEYEQLPERARVFPARPDAPAVVLDRTAGGFPILVPASHDEELGWGRVRTHTMAGGNFGASSDSRVGDALRAVSGQSFYGAVAIHDRVER